MVADTFLGSLVQSCCGEGGTLQTTLACARSDSATLGLPPLTECVLSRLYYLGSTSAEDCLRLALGCMHLPGLSRSGSGTQEVLRGADLVGLHFVPFPGPSSSDDEVFG